MESLSSISNPAISLSQCNTLARTGCEKVNKAVSKIVTMKVNLKIKRKALFVFLFDRGRLEMREYRLSLKPVRTGGLFW